MNIEVEPWPIPDPGHQTRISVPDVARDEIDAHQVALHRADPAVDPLDGHALLCRLKVAAGLMVLEKRHHIDEADWELAGAVMRVSDHTRDGVAIAAEQARIRANRARAHATAEREEIISDRKLARCRQAIERWIDKAEDGEQIARHDLRKRIKSDVRSHFDTSVAQLIDESKITEIASDYKTLYRKGPRGPSGPPPSTSGNDPWTTGTRGPSAAESDQGKRAEPPAAPGDPTADAPGYSERVQQIVERNRSRRREGEPDEPLCSACKSRPAGGRCRIEVSAPGAACYWHQKRAAL
jgi:hypothetical protein